MPKETHNRIGPFFFDVPDFDDCGGRTTRRIEVPKSVVKLILEAAYQSDLDYFAGQALAGWMSDPNHTFGKVTAKVCYDMAQAMLAERKRRGGGDE